MKSAQIQNIETTKKVLPLILATAIFMQMLDSTIPVSYTHLKVGTNLETILLLLNSKL